MFFTRRTTLSCPHCQAVLETWTDSLPIGRDRIGDQRRICHKCKQEYIDPDRKDWNKLPLSQKVAFMIEKPLYWLFFLPLGCALAGALVLGLTTVALDTIGVSKGVQRWITLLGFAIVVVIFGKILLSDIVEFFSELAKARRRRSETPCVGKQSTRIRNG